MLPSGVAPKPTGVKVSSGFILSYDITQTDVKNMSTDTDGGVGPPRIPAGWNPVVGDLFVKMIADPATGNERLH